MKKIASAAIAGFLPITLVHDGEPGLTTSGHIGDWPLGLPMIDITTIGAGGGSIARYSRDGALTVGPQSAGPTRARSAMTAVAPIRPSPTRTSCSAIWRRFLRCEAQRLGPRKPARARLHSSSGAISSSSAGRAAWLFPSHIPAFAYRSYDLVSSR